MRLGGDLEQRLRAAVQPALFRAVRAPLAVRVEETESDGRAELRFAVPDGTLCVEWKIQKKIFGFLNDTRNADGAFFVLVGDDAVEAHVVECKRTVTQDAWSKAKRQMRSTLLRLRALAGVLGVEITRVVCYTAYCDDELEPDSLPEPAESKISIGDDPPAPEDAEDLETVRRQFDWESEFVYLPDFGEPVPHRKLTLQQIDGVGVGYFPIDASGLVHAIS